MSFDKGFDRFLELGETPRCNLCFVTYSNKWGPNVLSQALNTLDAVAGVDDNKKAQKRAAPVEEVQVKVVPITEDQPKKKKQKVRK